MTTTELHLPPKARFHRGSSNHQAATSETIPLRLQDNPSFLAFPGELGHTRYGEGIMVGYRHYQTADVPVRYPFGYGLSYTTFATTGLDVQLTGDDTATVTVTITNTGDRAGQHVVQVYVATTAGRARRPARELRAFTKVALESGESPSLTMHLDRWAFAYYDTELGQWTVAPGEYTVQIGENVSTMVAESVVTLTGDVISRQLSLDSTVSDWFTHPIAGPVLRQQLSAGMTEEQARQAEDNADATRMVASMPMQQFLAFTGTTISSDTLEQLIEENQADAARQIS